MKITTEEILKLSQMSMLSLTKQEIPTLIDRLDNLLNYALGLQQLVKGHTESRMPHNINILRYDKVIKTDPKPLLKLAPQCEDNYYVVPAILKN